MSKGSKCGETSQKLNKARGTSWYPELRHQNASAVYPGRVALAVLELDDIQRVLEDNAKCLSSKHGRGVKPVMHTQPTAFHIFNPSPFLVPVFVSRYLWKPCGCEVSGFTLGSVLTIQKGSTNSLPEWPVDGPKPSLKHLWEGTSFLLHGPQLF